MRYNIKQILQNLAVTSMLLLTPLASAQSGADKNSQGHTSKYAGQQKREIKSLSADDIAELQSGAGWGLAKAAELNGVPGPIHLLEMKEAINLSESQIAAIKDLYQRMNSAAIQLGQALIEKERLLEQRFQSEVPAVEELKTMLHDIGNTRSELRFVHLSAHLETPDILTAEQLKKYNQLRGYADTDPCASVPEGHNEQMWKKHNNCE